MRPDADGWITAERFAEAIDERTALVCCTTVSYRSGHRHDVAGIAEAAHAKGALVLADSYQACGAVELDVRSLGADLVTGGTVKYLLGTAGLGFMWARPRGLRAARADPDRLVRRREHLRDVDRRLLPAPERPPLRLGHAARPGPLRRGRRACRSSRRWGSRRSRRTSPASSTRLIDGLDELGATVATPREPARRGPLVCVRSTDVDALVVHARRRARSSSRPARTRHGSRSTSTTWRRTSTGSSGRLPATARCSPDGRGADAAPRAVHRVRRASRPGREPPPSRAQGWAVAVRRPPSRGLLADRVGPHADDAARGRPRQRGGSRRGTSSTGVSGRRGAVGRGHSRTSPRPSIGWRTSTRSSRRAS